MKISDWFSIVAVLLVQGKGLHGELSRCASIKGYEHPTCVEWTYGVATVSHKRAASQSFSCRTRKLSNQRNGGQTTAGTSMDQQSRLKFPNTQELSTQNHMEY
ncbi:hypothetical protein H4Q26_000043 [Puccinia striiformis f. sp. tritici PST-130]|nr:hypothetical protein H4Q26_000043 [Puccinia striiformis f. sp. tritici PST-130]